MELLTKLLNFGGEFSSAFPNTAGVGKPSPSTKCRQYFEVEQSLNGQTFESVGRVNAKGYLATI